ncbi:MAG: hypothetical protein U9P71_08645, partial [Campylobacterota bacterium]|nr:hypothetical protein [Campylobacterota bacterium]
MKETGKVIFYNVNDGNGIIITPKKGKFPFGVIDWDDYEQTPSVGLEVEFSISNKSAIGVCVKKEKQVSSVSAIKDSVLGAINKPEAVVENDLSYRNRFDELMHNYERPSSIKLSMNAKKCISDYFNTIDRYIKKQSEYKKSYGKLSFLLMRRFIFTTFNNLTEMDMNFITPKIEKVKGDIMHMSDVYDDFKVKNSFPDTAFENIFLEKQQDYIKIELECSEVSDELQVLRKHELSLEKVMLKKHKEMKKLSGNSLRHAEDEYKVLKGTYVDIVHMCATLSERLHEDMEMLSEFRKVYKDQFIKDFKASSHSYEQLLESTLDAQAYIFDKMLWEKAKKSRIIKRFFSESQIKGEFSSKTYLKYYLDSLDREKASDDQRELFKLYRYLEELEQHTAVVMLSEIDEMLELKRIF